MNTIQPIVSGAAGFLGGLFVMFPFAIVGSFGSELIKRNETTFFLFLFSYLTSIGTGVYVGSKLGSAAGGLIHKSDFRGLDYLECQALGLAGAYWIHSSL